MEVSGKKEKTTNLMTFLLFRLQFSYFNFSSKLDYCNSLFYGLPDTSIKRLQRVQNSLARVIFPSIKRSDHITPTLTKTSLASNSINQSINQLNEFTERQVRGQARVGDAFQYNRSLPVHNSSG